MYVPRRGDLGLRHEARLPVSKFRYNVPKMDAITRDERPELGLIKKGTRLGVPFSDSGPLGFLI
jgi:hypothetical protein